jgi:hypothetical protein
MEIIIKVHAQMNLFSEIEKSRPAALFVTHVFSITFSPHVPVSDGIFALLLTCY